LYIDCTINIVQCTLSDPYRHRKDTAITTIITITTTTTTITTIVVVISYLMGALLAEQKRLTMSSSNHTNNSEIFQQFINTFIFVIIVCTVDVMSYMRRVERT